MIQEETLLTLVKEQQILESIRRDEKALVEKFKQDNANLYKKLSITRDSIKYLREEIESDAKISYLQTLKSDVGFGFKVIEENKRLKVLYPEEIIIK